MAADGAHPTTRTDSETSWRERKPARSARSFTPSGVGSVLLGLLIANAALGFVGIGVGGWGHNISTDGGTLDKGTWWAVSTLLQIIAGITLVATAVVWLIWQYVSAKALQRVMGEVSPTRHLVTWLIPLVNTVAPPILLFRATAGGVPVRSLLIWWLSWLAANGLTTTTLGTGPTGGDKMLWFVGADVAATVASIAAYFVVVQVTRIASLSPRD